MKRLYFLLPLLGLACSLPAQRFNIPLGGQIVVSEIREDYRPALQLLEAPYPDGESERGRLLRMKEDLALKYKDKEPGSHQKALGGAPMPWKGDNFRSNNTIDGVPNDNDMAISNDGNIVSVINSNIWAMTETGSVLANTSLDAWSLPLGISGDKFDPRALYDPVHDRFIIACLNGFTNSTSYIIVGFSQTNDPAGAWNLYALPGDPRGDTLWTDYPIMALSEHELFLTGNLLYNNQPWQTGFARSLCWQIDLDSAYLGGTLQTRLWDSVDFNGRPIRNLCPMQGGSSPSGTNMYLLSNRNFSTANDSVWIMEITDTMDAPGVQLTVDLAIADRQYGFPPNALQQFNQQLATNDARWLDGFIENGVIQFVGNCVDTSTGRAGIYHGIIRGLGGTPTVEGTVLGNPAGDYGYPGIAWMGMAPASEEALIGVNFVGTTVQTHPGCGAIYYDGNGNYSDHAVARAGGGYINALSGTDRWGDYMGIQPRYNQQGVVWTAGTWGPSNHLPATWIAEFHNPAIVAREEGIPMGVEVSAWPNPMANRVSLEFELPADELLDISLYDAQGRLVRTLLRDRVQAGRNRFAFSAEPLAPGVYLLRVEGEAGTVATKKVVKSE